MGKRFPLEAPLSYGLMIRLCRGFVKKKDALAAIKTAQSPMADYGSSEPVTVWS